MKPSRPIRRNWGDIPKEGIFQLVVAILLVFLCTLNFLASPPSELQVRHPDLETRVTACLRWAHFWKREHNFKNYSPGKLIGLKAFYSTSQVFVCLPEIEVWMSFTVGTDGRLVAMNSGLFYRSTPEELARRLLNPQPEVRVKSVSAERTTIEDHHPSETDVLRAYKAETLAFQLPELALPDYVRLGTVPRELESLKVVVSQAMVKWLCPKGAPLPEAAIPYFDVSDPWVYVAVDGNEQQRGHFVFEWRDGKWTSSKEWWPDRWERSGVISLVQRHVLSTVKIDCPR